MSTAPEADLRYLRKWLNERPNSPIDCAALARVLHWAALASKQAQSEPFWHAVVSNKSPVINKAIRREDVAQEYADQCHEQGYRDAEVVPLYLAPRPAEAQALPAKAWYFSRLAPSETLLAVEPNGTELVVKGGVMDSAAGQALLNRMTDALSSPAPPDSRVIADAHQVAAVPVSGVIVSLAPAPMNDRTFSALQAMTEGILTRGDPDYMGRRLTECVRVMADHGWQTPTPWPNLMPITVTFGPCGIGLGGGM